MFYGDESNTNDNEKSNLFAKYFSSVYRKFQDNADAELFSFIQSRNDTGYFNVTVTYDIVRKTLAAMDLSKGISPDKMVPLFLRECSDILATPLSILYSKSLEEHYYPKLWKIGIQYSVFKSGKKADITNYRGVSVSPNLVKVFEMIMFEQLKFNIYLQGNNM